MGSGKYTYDEIVRIYDHVLSRLPEVKRKGKKIPYTSLNGHMFTFIAPEGKLGIRLSDRDQEDFVEKYKTEPLLQYGKVMRGYVDVPNELLGNEDELIFYFEKSLEFIKTLKPK